jgi:hypothetical protein
MNEWDQAITDAVLGLSVVIFIFLIILIVISYCWWFSSHPLKRIVAWLAAMAVIASCVLIVYIWVLLVV